MSPAFIIVFLSSLVLQSVAQQQLISIPMAQREHALQLEQEGKFAEAQGAWSNLSKAFPRDSEPYAHLGLIKARLGFYREAVPLYRTALALNSKASGLRMNLALALFKAEDLKGALPEFEKCLKEAPSGSPEAQRLNLLIGISHYGLAQYSEAVPF